jgi:hypothetical protein
MLSNEATEAFEERVAIMLYHGKVDPDYANAEALADILEHFPIDTEQPEQMQLGL